jgi:peptide-methionine (R)-S-oxide reductase
MKNLILNSIFILLFASCSHGQTERIDEGDKKVLIEKTDAEWKEILTTEEYQILREKATERAFTGE